MNSKPLFFLLAAGFLAGCSGKPQIAEEQTPAASELIVTETGAEIRLFNLSLRAVKEGGGRIVSLKFEDTEMLSPASVHPTNWGSTFWTSPQAEWGWPPPKTYDEIPYELSAENGSIFFRGTKDSLTNYRIDKQISAQESDTSFVIKYTITNLSDSVKSVAAWEITRVPPGGLTFFPGDSAKVSAPFTLLKTGKMVWFDYKNAKIQEGHDKLRADGNEGWLAHVQGNLIFIKIFRNLTAEECAPDNEAEIEVYANPDKLYVELEPQGPYTRLEAGQSFSWKVKWKLRKLPAELRAEAENEALPRFVRSLLN